jgi:isopenicillin N synthase-like dioxygenase
MTDMPIIDFARFRQGGAADRRAVAQAVERAADSRRQSLVFFHNPNYDAPVECLPSCRSAERPPKYPPTTSGEYLRSRFTATQIAMKPAYVD